MRIPRGIMRSVITTFQRVNVDTKGGRVQEPVLTDLKADVALLRLPAPGLRGTFAKAYHLLTLLASKIGWDELLKTRSQVFVMEEEYRLHKTHASVDLNGINDASSIAGLKSPPSTGRPEQSDIPTIRISTESARTPNGEISQSRFPNSVGEPSEENLETDTEHEHEQGSIRSSLDGDGSELEDRPTEAETVLEKPQIAHEKEDASGAGGVISGEGDEAVSAFSNKRLCERWLGESWLRNRHSSMCADLNSDNLFL